MLQVTTEVQDAREDVAFQDEGNDAPKDQAGDQQRDHQVSDRLPAFQVDRTGQVDAHEQGGLAVDVR